MTAEFDVSQAITPADGVSVFVLKVDECVSPKMAKFIRAHWEQVWRQAGREPAPALMVLDRTMHLSALHDAQLLELGLMRIP